MKPIAEGEAFQQLEQWRSECGTVDVALARSSRQRTVSVAAVSQVLPHSRKVLLTIDDEHGVGVCGGGRRRAGICRCELGGVFVGAISEREPVYVWATGGVTKGDSRKGIG